MNEGGGGAATTGRATLETRWTPSRVRITLSRGRAGDVRHAHGDVDERAHGRWRRETGTRHGAARLRSRLRIRRRRRARPARVRRRHTRRPLERVIDRPLFLHERSPHRAFLFVPSRLRARVLARRFAFRRETPPRRRRAVPARAQSRPRLGFQFHARKRHRRSIDRDRRPRRIDVRV